MNPCIFYHAGRSVQTVVHGDNYTSVGTPEMLQWLRTELENKYESKTSVIGHGPGAVPEGRVLNQIIRFTHAGIEYEADQRHAEFIAQEMQVQGEKPYLIPMEKGPIIKIHTNHC